MASPSRVNHQSLSLMSGGRTSIPMAAHSRMYLAIESDEESSELSMAAMKATGWWALR